MEIRLFQPEDTESFVDVLHEMSRHYNGENASTREAVRANLIANVLRKDSDERIVVAVSELRVIGLATISILYPARKERAQLFMKELYVSDADRSHRIGEQLMRWIAAYALARNCARF